MPKLPDQRGFYDDLRPFQRRDIRVRTDAFAPSPTQQRRTQWIVGILFLLFLAGAAAARLFNAREEGRTPLKPAPFPPAPSAMRR